MAIAHVAQALELLGFPADRAPPRPVLRGTGGTLLTVALAEPDGRCLWAGVWIPAAGVQFVDVPRLPPGVIPEARDLPEPSGPLVVLLVEAARRFLLRAEEVDARAADLQTRGRAVPLADVWKLRREVAAIRAQLDRNLVLVAECEGSFAPRFPGFETVAPSIRSEYERVRELIQGLQSTLSDLVLLRNAEESNRIAEAANNLSRISNRIATLANISNIRMLGIAYLAFLLALIGAVVLIPNTGATILGMPSATWVPGIWVDIILAVLAVVPIFVVFRQRWIQRLLLDLRTFETRAEEGIQDLPERVSPEGAAGRTGDPTRGPAAPHPPPGAP